MNIHNEDIPKREVIVSPFMKEADLGFIYAPRGLGKTWLALGLAKVIATGGSLGHWQGGGGTPKRVLMIDGEMNLDATQERLSLLGISTSQIDLLHHEKLFNESEGRITLNLTDQEQQLEIINLIEAKGSQVVFIDNLSCLFHGMKENDADAWEQVLPWLLEIRRRGVSIIMIAHAGRNGLMRGTSRREDSAHWVLSLEPCEDSDAFEGARFKSRFQKNRNSTPDTCPPLIWEFKHTEEALEVTSKTMTDRDELLNHINNGMSSATALAEELKVSKGTISKWAKSLAQSNKIIIENRNYLPMKN